MDVVLIFVGTAKKQALIVSPAPFELIRWILPFNPEQLYGLNEFRDGTPRSNATHIEDHRNYCGHAGLTYSTCDFLCLIL